MLRFSELRAANLERLDAFHPIEAWSALEWAATVGGEAGEVLEATLGLLVSVGRMQELAKKRHRGDDVAVHAIGQEAADVVIYADLLCARLGLDLGQCVVDTFNNKSREIGAGVMLAPEGMAV